MSEQAKQEIPVLTEIIADNADGAVLRVDTESLIAELQTRLAASTFELTEQLMRAAFAEMEAKLHAQISMQLRRDLPELIDTVLREQLADKEEQD